MAGVYSFWKYVSKLERRETRRYLEMFYILKFRDLVSAGVSVAAVPWFAHNIIYIKILKFTEVHKLKGVCK